MKKIMIRKAHLNEAPKIAEFNRRMAKETENIILDPEKAYSGVKNLFDQPELGFYTIAQIDNNIVGSLMITTEWSDWRDGIIWWIQSVYILPEYRRQGVFRKLYAYIQNMASGQKIAGLRLYVEKNNVNAQKTYQSLGMKETSYKMFEEILKKL